MERPRTLILFDTNELLQPLPRKLHAAWAEMHERHLHIPPTVAIELAPRGYPPNDFGGVSAAEERLRRGTTDLTKQEAGRLKQEAWWAQMWRRADTPYRLVHLNKDQQRLAEELENQIPYDCFVNTKPGYVRGHRDTKIVCETLAVGGTILLTSNVRSIKHHKVNAWAIANGDKLGVQAKPVVQDTDTMMQRSIRRRHKLEAWLQSGLMACWPADDNAPSQQIVDGTIQALEYMTEGRLPGAGEQLIDGLKTHQNAHQLVETVRAQLPSSTITTDREHPSYPRTTGEKRQTSPRARNKVVFQPADPELFSNGKIDHSKDTPGVRRKNAPVGGTSIPTQRHGNKPSGPGDDDPGGHDH